MTTNNSTAPAAKPYRVDLWGVYWANWAYIELVGPDIRLIAKNPRYSAKRARPSAAPATTTRWDGEP